MAPPPADAQVIAGTILGIAGMSINASIGGIGNEKKRTKWRALPMTI
jgi:hypothetical protein